jgi:hypothetical protein
VEESKTGCWQCCFWRLLIVVVGADCYFFFEPAVLSFILGVVFVDKIVVLIFKFVVLVRREKMS